MRVAERAVISANGALFEPATRRQASLPVTERVCRWTWTRGEGEPAGRHAIGRRGNVLRVGEQFWFIGFRVGDTVNRYNSAIRGAVARSDTAPTGKMPLRNVISTDTGETRV